MKLTKKITGIPLITTAVTLIVLIITMYLSNQSKTEINRVEKGLYPILLDISDVANMLNNLKRFYIDATTFNEKELINTAKIYGDSIAARIDIIVANQFSQDLKIDEINVQLRQYSELAGSVTNAMMAGDMGEKVMSNAGIMNDHFNTLETTIALIQNEINRLIQTSFEKVVKLNRMVIMFLIVLLIISVLSLLGIIYLTRLVVKVLRIAVDRLKDIAQGEGDLRKRITISADDETGELAHWFNIFIAKIHDIIKAIIGEVALLNKYTNELTAVTEKITGSSALLTKQASESTHIVAQTSTTVSTVSSSVEAANSNLTTMAAAAEQMSVTINEIAKNTDNAKTATNDARDKVQQAVTRVNEFGEKTADIRDIVQTINKLADQTNLLALNATIEAASAGEFGKGFAVVAQEIKELAKQSNTSASNIAELIQSVTDSINNTIGDMVNINEIIKNLDLFMCTIASAIEEQSIGTKEIVGNITRATTGVNDIANNFINISNAMNTAAHNSELSLESCNDVVNETGVITTSSNQLKDMASRIDSLVGKFTVD